MKSILSWGLMALLVAFGPMAGSAQVRPGGPPGQRLQRQELEGRVQQGFGRMVAERLGLERDQLSTLQEVMQSFREDRMRLNRDQASLRHRLRDPALQEVDEVEARALLDEMVRVQEAELELYRREQVELLTVLTPQQLVLFYRIRDEWGERIQQLRQGGPGGPGGMSGMVGPGSRGGTEGWPGGMGGSVGWDEGIPRFR